MFDPSILVSSKKVSLAFWLRFWPSCEDRVDAFKPRRGFALPVADALRSAGEHRVTRVCGLVEEAEEAFQH